MPLLSRYEAMKMYAAAAKLHDATSRVLCPLIDVAKKVLKDIKESPMVEIDSSTPEPMERKKRKAGRPTSVAAAASSVSLATAAVFTASASSTEHVDEEDRACVKSSEGYGMRGSSPIPYGYGYELDPRCGQSWGAGASVPPQLQQQSWVEGGPQQQWGAGVFQYAQPMMRQAQGGLSYLAIEAPPGMGRSVAPGSGRGGGGRTGRGGGRGN
jgi:hypothetical protein